MAATGVLFAVPTYESICGKVGDICDEKAKYYRAYKEGKTNFNKKLCKLLPEFSGPDVDEYSERT